MDGPLDRPQVDDSEYAELAEMIMHRQATLSRRVAAVFLIILFGLPLVNLTLREKANAPIFGFTYTWLILGILFYPITWILSWYFIKESDRIEAESDQWGHLLPGRGSGESTPDSEGKS